MNYTDRIFKSPLTSVLVLQSEDLNSYVQELDEFFMKEYILLSEKINDINQNLSHYMNVAKDYNMEKCERRSHVLNATKRMLSVKIKNLASQEQMIISALKLEEKKLTKDTEQLLRKYELI